MSPQKKKCRKRYYVVFIPGSTSLKVTIALKGYWIGDIDGIVSADAMAVITYAPSQSSPSVIYFFADFDTGPSSPVGTAGSVSAQVTIGLPII